MRMIEKTIIVKKIDGAKSLPSSKELKKSKLRWKKYLDRGEKKDLIFG